MRLHSPKRRSRPGVKSWREAATQVAEIDAKIETIKSQAKVSLDEEKGVALSVRRRMRNLADEIIGRSAMADVECERRVADDNSMVEIVRTDTGEIIDTGALTAEDRQMELMEAQDQASQQQALKEVRDEVREGLPDGVTLVPEPAIEEPKQ